MIDFQQEDRTQQRVIGAAATFAYAALVLLLLLLVRFTLAEPPDTGEGLMINFGNVTEAAPGEDLAMNDEAADAPQQTQAPSEAQPDEQEQMTQQTDEDVPVVKEEKKRENYEFPVSASVGYALGKHSQLKDIIAAADKDMYANKRICRESAK